MIFVLSYAKWRPNHSMQRTGASRLAQFQLQTQCRLAPAADAEC
jgi:hypothetical protein